jgi:hypothetical protein
VLRQHLGDEDLELFHLMIADVGAAFLGERLLQRSALVHCGGGDHAAIVRDRLHSSELSRSHFHQLILYREN